MATIKKFHLPSCRGGECKCQWALDYRPLGVRGKRRRMRFETKKGAERFLAETAVKAARGEYLEPARVPTFREVAEDFYRTKTTFRPSHVFNIRTRLDKQILPRFGDEKIDRISVAAVEALRDVMRDQGYAPKTINPTLQLVAAVFRLAIRRGQCTRNPGEIVERVVAPAVELTFGGETGSSDDVRPDAILAPDEIGRLLDAATSGLWQTLFKTAFLTGARSGELLSLRWTDVELPREGNGKMSIRRSLTWSRLKGEPARPRLFPPKTRAGLRTIGIPPALVSDLRRWKLQCPPTKDNLVFPDFEGKYMRREHLLRRGFYPTLARAGLRTLTFHSLRHSCASVLIKCGTPLTEIQHHLGHANPAITLRVYSHWFSDATDTIVADKLAEVIAEHLDSSPEIEKSGHFVGTPAGRIAPASP
jgi:integrase